jgi:hypothetical protein
MNFDFNDEQRAIKDAARDMLAARYPLEEVRRLALEEERDAAYQALRDLEQELHTGKVTAADYELERSRLRAEAAAALRELNRLP